MIKFISAIAIVGFSLSAVPAQGIPGGAGSPPKNLLLTSASPSGSRARIVGRDGKGGERDEPRPLNSSSDTEPGPVEKPSTIASNHPRGDNSSRANGAPTNLAPSAKLRVPSEALSQEYRVGVGDVLDVQLADLPTRASTLFTVREGGALDYPLAGESVLVAGLTAAEIAIKLRLRIKVLENPKVVVKVRDYASHNVIITGFVADPGAKFLRREAIPLYVVLAEAQPRPEATSATITRAGQPAIKVDLMDHQSTSTLVMPGDLIKVVGRASESAGFFYAGGALNLPGQKIFHAELTLTQAILASGGVTRDAGHKVKIARQGADGRLTTTEFNWRLIQEGKSVDPVLQRGDRITVENH